MKLVGATMVHILLPLGFGILLENLEEEGFLRFAEILLLLLLKAKKLHFVVISIFAYAIAYC